MTYLDLRKAGLVMAVLLAGASSRLPAEEASGGAGEDLQKRYDKLQEQTAAFGGTAERALNLEHGVRPTRTEMVPWNGRRKVEDRGMGAWGAPQSDGWDTLASLQMLERRDFRVMIDPGALEYGPGPEAARKRLAALMQASQNFTPETDRATVLAVLGIPESRGHGGWGRFDTEFWQYLSYLDAEESFSFYVTFDPKAGTSFSGSQVRREDVRKRKKVSVGGTVQSVLLNAYGPGSLLCDVRFDDGMPGPLVVMDRRSVKGDPETGGRVQVELYGFPGTYMFQGALAFYLESIEFTPPAVKKSRKAEGRAKP